ncbi:TPA: hypothetical protein ACGF6F_003890, partial [Vibrio cholerae]
MSYQLDDDAKVVNLHLNSMIVNCIHNARLRGWQRMTTKLKHNNRNHFGSLGLETPRVDSP